VSEASSPDRESRRRIIEERHRSILVEASAGTGKTHSLVSALVGRSVLSTPFLRLDRIAAVTFTEKAAGEMKDRLRRALEDVARDHAGEKVRRRAAEALVELERAEVATIHSLCATILRERPVEAGLDPFFAQLDAAAGPDLAAAVWRLWWRGELEREPRGALAECLRAGMRIGDPSDRGVSLAGLALALYRDRARLSEARPPDFDPSRAVATARAWAPVLDQWRRMAEISDDPKVRGLEAIQRWLEALPASPEGLERAGEEAPPLDFRRGKRTGVWPEEIAAEIRRWHKGSFQPFLEEIKSARDWPLLGALFGRLLDPEDGFLAAVAAEKNRRSLVDFDDLLLRARDLLKASPAARAYFAGRFQLVAVDEFQDTDPIQMEILLRLTAEDGGREDWRDLRPGPGRLLVVGDPKQSIYRFRRADVETYHALRTSLFPEVETLRENRRSAPPILEWVNRVFERVLVFDERRPFEVGYAPIEATRARPEPADRRVLYLDPPPGWTGAKPSDWQDEEAEAVARFLSAALRSGRFRAREGRPARPGDVAILVGRNDAMGRFQDALARCGIASVAEGGTEFYRREETAAAVQALCAIDDPADGVALCAALKSFLFGFSDEDLFLARDAGAAIDFRRPERSPEELRRALELFAGLHRRRHERPASETLSDLLEATMAVECARAQNPGGLQAASNLRRLVAACRECEEIGGAPFGAVVRQLRARFEERAAEPHAFEEQEDAVRVLTVHKAKGREFPVVVVVDSGRDPVPRRGTNPIYLARADGTWGCTAGVAGRRVRTPGFHEARSGDAERQRAEQKRLLYIAATRAMDYLVLSRWRGILALKTGTSDPVASTVLGLIEPHAAPERLPSLVEVVRAPARAPIPPPGEPAAPDPAAELRARLSAIDRARARAEATRSASLRAAGGERSGPEDAPASDRGSSTEIDHARRVGLAVHEALERIVAAPADSARAVSEACASWGLAGRHAREAAEMVATAADSPLLRSFRGRRVLAECPILFRSPEDGALVEGKIDLLAQEERGWTIVDYKTDDVSRFQGDPAREKAHFEQYASQLREYRTALELLGLRVHRTLVLSARTGASYEIGP
jgi:ATP-dependent helicase/nuclease subunit A